MGEKISGAPLRRDEALAIIVDSLARHGSSPTFEEIGKRLQPPVCKRRAIQIVDQLIERGIIEKVPGAIRALRVRDVAYARQIAAQYARKIGWTVAVPGGDLEQPPEVVMIPASLYTLPSVQLHVLAPFEHLPDPD